MPIVAIPEKGMVIEFPPDMSPEEIETAIRTQVFQEAPPAWVDVAGPKELAPPLEQGTTAPITPDPGLDNIGPGTQRPAGAPPQGAGMGRRVPEATLDPESAPTSPINVPVFDLAIAVPPELRKGREGLDDAPHRDEVPQFIHDALMPGGELPEGLGYLQGLTEQAVDYWADLLMTSEEEEAMRVKYPNLSAARYAAASLVLPGVSHFMASPTERDEFLAKSPEEQRLDMMQLSAGYIIFSAFMHKGGLIDDGLKALAKHAQANPNGWVAKNLLSGFKNWPGVRNVLESKWFKGLSEWQQAQTTAGYANLKAKGYADNEALKILKRRAQEGKPGAAKKFEEGKRIATEERGLKGDEPAAPKTPPVEKPAAPAEPLVPKSKRVKAVETMYQGSYDAAKEYPGVAHKDLVLVDIYDKPGQGGKILDTRYATRDNVNEVLAQAAKDYEGAWITSSYDLTPYRPRKGEISYKEYAKQRDAGVDAVEMMKAEKPAAVVKKTGKMTADQYSLIEEAIEVHRNYLNAGDETWLTMESGIDDGIITGKQAEEILKRIIFLERKGKLGLVGAEKIFMEKHFNDWFDSEFMGKKSAEPALKPKEIAAPEPPSVTLPEMVKEAQRWKGAAVKADKLYPEGDTRARLRHSNTTTKGDLDAYLIKKYGISDTMARDVSNELTRGNLKPDMTVEVKDFTGEPWADAALKTVAPPAKPAPKGKAAKVEEFEKKKATQVAKKPKAKKKPRDFRDAIRQAGGIRPNDKTLKGELKDISRTADAKGRKKFAPGFGFGFFNNKARGSDEIVLWAIQEGWLPPGADENTLMLLIKENPKEPAFTAKDDIEGITQDLIDQEDAYYAEKENYIDTYTEEEFNAAEAQVRRFVAAEEESRALSPERLTEIFNTPVKELIKLLTEGPSAAAVLVDYRKKYGESIPIVLVKGDRKSGIVIHKSTKKPGSYQMTYWDDTGMSGDTTVKGELKAIKEAWAEGYRIPDPEAFESIVKTNRFIISSKALEHWQDWMDPPKSGPAIQMGGPKGEAPPKKAISDDDAAFQKRWSKTMQSAATRKMKKDLHREIAEHPNTRKRKQAGLFDKAEEDLELKPSEPASKEEELQAKKLFGGGKDDKGFGDTGGYATNLKSTIELPEIVELARQLLGGKYHRVRERLNSPMWAGVFYPGAPGRIELLANLFANPDQAAATLAHEIGHLVDYLPDLTMKRGNVLGRIATLKSHLKHTIPHKPGALEGLTDKDRARIRGQAKKLAEKGADEWIDEIIRKEMPITAADVLAIWNSVEGSNLIIPELEDYIKGLNTPEKKAIVKDALKGQVPGELKQFAKVSEEATGKKIKQPLYDEVTDPKTGKKKKVPTKRFKKLIHQKYVELINAEIKKRKLWHLDEMVDELKDLTRTWKPFDPAANPKFTKYRYKPEELYADAISALINAPGLLKAKAPSFYEAFFNYLERKPKVKKLYEQIQDDIMSGKVEKDRTKRIYQMFRRGDDAYALSLEKRYSKFDGTMRELVDVNWPTIKKVRHLGERTIPAGENPRYKLEEMAYSGSEAEWYLNQAWRGAIKPLEDASLTWDDFGVDLYLKRVAGERAELANPQGWTPQLAETKLAELKANRSELQNKAMDQAMAKFQELRSYVIEKGKEAGRWPADLVKLMEDTPEYATFDVVKYIEKRWGSAPSAKIYRQIGTLNEVANPGTATILKDMAIIKAINRQVAAESVASFFRKHYPDEIEPAVKKWNGRFKEIQNPVDPAQGLLVYLKNGKPKGYYVHKWVAEQFDRNPIEASHIANVLRWSVQPFRMAFTELNYGFWMFNVWRDYFRASTNLPKSSLVKFFPHYLKGLKSGMKSAYGIPDKAAEQALQGKMLISMADYRGLETSDSELERLLKRYHMKKQTWDNKLMKPLGLFFTYYTNIGRGLERATKLGSYFYLKKKFPEMPEEELRHIVRVSGGSPDFLRKGGMYPITNNLLLFSNAIKEGWRGDYEAFADSPGEFMWKKAKYVYIPKLLMYAASLGLLGAGTKAIMDGASEYDKTNYFIIPLALTESGKSVYLRIPTDESGRFMGGILWKLLSRDSKKMTTGLFDYMAGQAPTIHPGIDVMTGTLQYLSGLNPYDSFRGRYAIPEQVFAAGGQAKREAFLKWIYNKSGGTIVYRMKYDDLDRVRSELEKVIGYPFASNALGRFLKVSNQGLREILQEEKFEIRDSRAKEILEIKDIVIKFVNGDPVTDEEFARYTTELMNGTDLINRNMMVNLAKKYGAVYAEQYFTATSFEEKAAVMKRMRERQQLLKEKSR